MWQSDDGTITPYQFNIVRWLAPEGCEQRLDPLGANCLDQNERSDEVDVGWAL